MTQQEQQLYDFEQELDELKELLKKVNDNTMFVIISNDIKLLEKRIDRLKLNIK